MISEIVSCPTQLKRGSTDRINIILLFFRTNIISKKKQTINVFYIGNQLMREVFRLALDWQWVLPASVQIISRKCSKSLCVFHHKIHPKFVQLNRYAVSPTMAITTPVKNYWPNQGWRIELKLHIWVWFFFISGSF